MEVNLMNISEILFEVLWVIFFSLCLILFVISRKMIKRENLLLKKLSDEEINSIRMRDSNPKIVLIISLGVAIVCCIYLVISLVNKGLLISFFGEALNEVIYSVIIVLVLLPNILDSIHTIRRYNKVKKIIEGK